MGLDNVGIISWLATLHLSTMISSSPSSPWSPCCTTAQLSWSSLLFMRPSQRGGHSDNYLYYNTKLQSYSSQLMQTARVRYFNRQLLFLIISTSSLCWSLTPGTGEYCGKYFNVFIFTNKFSKYLKCLIFQKNTLKSNEFYLNFAIKLYKCIKRG